MISYAGVICFIRRFTSGSAIELLEAASTNTVIESLTLAIPDDAKTLYIESTLLQKLDTLNATRTEHGLTTLKFNIKFIQSL